MSDRMGAIATIANPRLAVIPTTEYVFNAHRDQLSHLVVEDTFSDFGDTATICGRVVTSADMFPEYPTCAECAEGAHDD